VQGTGTRRSGGGPRTACGGETKQQAVWKAEAMLLQKGVESVLFRGRNLAGETNAEKLERFARDLAKEHARRKQKQQAAASPGPGAGRPPPAAVIKQQTTTASAVVAAKTVTEARKRAPETSSSSRGAGKTTL
jgi:hypothetical protein